MKQISNELKIGLVALGAIIVAFIGFRIMQDQPFFSQVKVLYTKYENVEGLIRGSNVYVGGFRIGAVKEMRYQMDSDSIEVTINIVEPIPIPIGSKAQLSAPDFLGSSTIKILRNDTTEILPWGSYIEGVQKGGLLESFSQKGSKISDSLTVSLTKVNNILREMEKVGADDINATVSNFKETSDALREIVDRRKTEIDSMIIDARNTMRNMSEVSDSTQVDFQSLISNLETFSSELDDLSADLKESSESLGSILGKIDTGEGSLGKLINDPSLYNNLDSLTLNLNDLIKKIEKDPGRYLKHMRLIEVF